MAKKKRKLTPKAQEQQQVVEFELDKDNAPDKKCNITLVRMVKYIQSYAPEDKDWFVNLCSENKSETAKYGYNVSRIRNEFIARYYPNAYEKKKKEKKPTQTEIFEDLIANW